MAPLALYPALIVGAVAGLHVSTWGMFKDSPYEGFSAAKYARSIIVAMLAAVGAQLLLRVDLARAGGLVVLFGVTYALERGLVEIWKAFLRREDQSKYTIPMAFAVRGRVVGGTVARLAAGAGYVGAVAAVALALHALPPAAATTRGTLLLVALGSVGGWICALGGAWKDAPIEGFETLKFFRSPIIATAWAVLLAQCSDSFAAVAFGALGWSIATIETHKKFGEPLKAPGKFAGKTIRHPQMFGRRRLAIPVFALLWVLLLGVVARSIAEIGAPAAPLSLGELVRE
jgi:hypothetical protein